MYEAPALLAVILFVGMAIYLRGLKPSIAAAQLTFSEAAFRRVLEGWTPESRQSFAAHFWVDYVFIALYAAAGWLYGQSQLGDASAGRSLAQGLLTFSLPLAAVADVLENVFHQRFLRAQPGSLPPWCFAAAGVAACAKFALMLLFTAALIYQL